MPIEKKKYICSKCGESMEIEYDPEAKNDYFCKCGHRFSLP